MAHLLFRTVLRANYGHSSDDDEAKVLCPIADEYEDIVWDAKTLACSCWLVRMLRGIIVIYLSYFFVICDKQQQ